MGLLPAKLRRRFGPADGGAAGQRTPSADSLGRRLAAISAETTDVSRKIDGRSAVFARDARLHTGAVGTVQAGRGFFQLPDGGRAADRARGNSRLLSGVRLRPRGSEPEASARSLFKSRGIACCAAAFGDRRFRRGRRQRKSGGSRCFAGFRGGSGGGRTTRDSCQATNCAAVIE
jgi:hypothetical protein